MIVELLAVCFRPGPAIVTPPMPGFAPALIAAADAPLFTSTLVIWILLSATVILAAAAAARMIRRADDPIDALIEQARTLDPRRLDQRIAPIPGKHRINELVEVINRMLERLESASKTQQRFFSHISHELRTPLSVLLMESRAMRDKLKDASDTREYVIAVEQESARLHRIVDAFLILTRATAAVRPSVDVAVPIEELALEAIRRCRAEAAERNVRIVPKLSGEPALESNLVGDVELLCTALANIVRNAVRHSPAGESVELQARIDNGNVSFVVIDQGQGIPDDCMERIYDLFYKVAKNSEELGVGLSIAQAVAKLHGGSVSARNLPNKGCEFTLSLPLSNVAT